MDIKLFLLTFGTMWKLSSGLENNSEFCIEIINVTGNDSRKESGMNPTIEKWEAIIMFFGVGCMAVCLAYVFNFIRKSVYKDKDNLDIAFDAGGTVSMGLTCTTLVSQWTWAATLLTSSSVTAKYGICGAFWYASSATVQLLLFSIFSVHLKVRAPGAKTFLQVIRARFGKTTHLIYGAFALLTNIIVTAMLMLGSTAVIISLVKDCTIEFSTMIIVLIAGSFSHIGGLGATFYVSYITTLVSFVIILLFSFQIFNTKQDNSTSSIGDLKAMYESLLCLEGPEGNFKHSYLTMLSNDGFRFGVIGTVGDFGTVFLDQSYWQSTVAAKPKQGVWGFITGGLTWFAVPFAFGTAMGIAYLTLCAEKGGPILNKVDVDSGLIAPYVAHELLGKNGQLLLLLLVVMSVTSTASAEVMAVVSIEVYDYLQSYIMPFCKVFDSNSCIICGQQRGRMANPKDKCTCESMTFCKECKDDDERVKQCKRVIKPSRKCKTHTEFRKYQDIISDKKNWCFLFTIISLIPQTLILQYTQINLGYLYYFMGIVIGSAVIPTALAMCWTRLTAKAMILAAPIGCVVGLITWLVFTGLDGGLWPSTFLEHSGKELPMFAGNIASMVTGGIIVVVATWVTNWNYDLDSAMDTWEKTRDIDSPLFPWAEAYARELGLTNAHKLDNRPTLQDVKNCFSNSFWTAYIVGSTLPVLIIIVWPGIAASLGVFSYENFQGWIHLTQVSAILAGAFVIITPFVSEIHGLYNVMKDNSRVGPLHDNNQVQPITKDMNLSAA